MLLQGKQWYDEDLTEKQRSEYLFGLMKTLDTNQMGVQQNNLRCLRLYNNQEITGLSIANYVLSSTPGNIGVARQNRLTLNVIKSSIDTLISKMAKDSRCREYSRRVPCRGNCPTPFPGDR